MKKLLIKPLWIALACLFTVLFIGMLIGGSIANTYARPINDYFGLENFRTETIGDTEDIDSEYYKSNFVQYNEDGSIKYTTDEETGYKHQLTTIRRSSITVSKRQDRYRRKERPSFGTTPKAVRSKDFLSPRATG